MQTPMMISMLSTSLTNRDLKQNSAKASLVTNTEPLSVIRGLTSSSPTPQDHQVSSR